MDRIRRPRLPGDAALPRRDARSCPSTSVLFTWLAVLTGILALSSPARAQSLSELENTSNLNPKKFIRLFGEFDYQLHYEVQPPNQFLSNRSGDCDDFAIMADHILPLDGYETRLVHVRLAGMVAHAVCYVTEDRVYLDYNNRGFLFPLAKSKPALRTIADKVAESLNANWTSASEFIYTYESKRKIITATVVRTQDPRQDPPPRKATAPQKKSSLLVQ